MHNDTEHGHEHHHSHHHHSHHHHSKGYRFKKWLERNRKKIIAGIACILIAAGILAVILMQQRKLQQSQHITAGNSHNLGAGYREIVHNGKKYKYNSLITTVLYAGLDSDDEIGALTRHGNAPRADSIALVVLDKRKGEMTILSMNRDTMTEIKKISFLGETYVYGVGHLGQSYTYGDGRESSVENLVEAVEKLLNVPVNDYFITNRGSLEYINDIVGGVTVTVPNDDLVEKHPEMTEGAEVEITDDLVEDYVRYRDTTIDFSNEGRIDRQSSYINAYIEKLQSMLPDQITDIWETLEDIDHFIQTSVTKNKYLQYANLLNAIEYGEGDFIKLPGEDVNGEDYDEFYVDEDALRELVVDLFYLPA